MSYLTVWTSKAGVSYCKPVGKEARESNSQTRSPSIVSELFFFFFFPPHNSGELGASGYTSAAPIPAMGESVVPLFLVCGSEPRGLQQDGQDHDLHHSRRHVVPLACFLPQLAILVTRGVFARSYKIPAHFLSWKFATNLEHLCQRTKIKNNAHSKQKLMGINVQ